MPRTICHAPMEAAEAIDQLLGWVLVRHHDTQSEETFVECKLCGEWEDHRSLCPVPALQAFMNASDEEVAKS